MANAEEMIDGVHSDLLMNRTIETIVWEYIGVTVKNRRTGEAKDILSSVHGMVKKGEMLAIMGPSGSGKSTLLNILAQKNPLVDSKVEGKVFANCTPVTPRRFRALSAYVEQEDALVGALTVREKLDYAARFSLSTLITKLERRQRVEMLIEKFGLANDSIGTPIKKGISGGQKRRVSVAVQLIVNPKVLFLHEPTSGLDSTAALDIISYLKSRAIVPWDGWCFS